MDLKEELRLHEEEELHLATDIDQGLVAVTDRRMIVTHAVRGSSMDSRPSLARRAGDGRAPLLRALEPALLQPGHEDPPTMGCG